MTVTSREYFTVCWSDLYPYGPSWGLIEHLGCQSLEERFFRDTLYLPNTNITIRFQLFNYLWDNSMV